MRLWLGRFQALSTISGLKTSPNLSNPFLIGVYSGHSCVSVKGLNVSGRHKLLSAEQLQPFKQLTEMEEELVEEKAEMKCAGYCRAACDGLDTTGASELAELQQMVASLSVGTESNKGEMTTTVIESLLRPSTSHKACSKRPQKPSVKEQRALDTQKANPEELWCNGPLRSFLPSFLPVPELVFVDEHVAVANKPSGLLCVPGTIVKDSLAVRVANALGHFRVDRMVVHRLDQETSGIVLFSRTRNALTSLHELFRLRKVEKTYTAIVWGHLTDDEGQIDLPLARKPNSPPLYCVNTELGKPSLTKWVVRKRLENPPRTIVNLTPITGRSHQLRIHMAEMGHPILGDSFYAHEEAKILANRCLLHAERLKLDHPITVTMVYLHDETTKWWMVFLRTFHHHGFVCTPLVLRVQKSRMWMDFN